MFERSREFYLRFNTIFFKDNPKRQEAISKYTNNTAFTAFITNELNSIINTMGYIPQNEYYRIDAMGYTSRWNELEQIQGFYSYLWDLEIAVEHENEAAKWLDEVVKLAHICCPLRVVIGYVPLEQRTYGDAERLAYVSSALKQLKCRANIKSGEFMVILGNSNTKNQEEFFFNYKAYILNTETLCFETLDSYL